MFTGILHGKTGLLTGFVPLVAYGLLAGTTTGSIVLALGAAAAVTILAGWSDLRKGMILTWATFLLFGGLFLAVAVLSMDGIVPWITIVTYTVLAAVSFGSIAAGIPFTLQYAREMVDPQLHTRPGFIRANILMTAVWGAVFAASLALSCLARADPPIGG